jgi:hypothetical protein
METEPWVKTVTVGFSAACLPTFEDKGMILWITSTVLSGFSFAICFLSLAYILTLRNWRFVLYTQLRSLIFLLFFFLSVISLQLLIYLSFDDPPGEYAVCVALSPPLEPDCHRETDYWFYFSEIVIFFSYTILCCITMYLTHPSIISWWWILLTERKIETVWHGSLTLTLRVQNGEEEEKPLGYGEEEEKPLSVQAGGYGV